MTELKKPAGQGGKRPLLYVDNSRLLLDEKNPRLPKEFQVSNQEILQKTLLRYFNIGELASSMSENGYFDEEPLVGIPVDLPTAFHNKEYDQLKNSREYQSFLEKPSTKFIIVEGNRRLCTVKVLLEGSRFPALTPAVREDLEKLPVIIYPSRKDVIAYLGVRHIIGITKWDAYAKASYVASMYKEYGMSIDDIQKMVGDTTNSARKTYTSYRLIELAEDELSLNMQDAKRNFSFITLALGQSAIKNFLNIPAKWNQIDPDYPVSEEKYDNLKDLFSWLFGEGAHKPRVINESRDITSRLSDVLRSETATEHLRITRNLESAWERSDGELNLVIKFLKRGRENLRSALGLVTDNNQPEVRKLIEECKNASDSLVKLTN